MGTDSLSPFASAQQGQQPLQGANEEDTAVAPTHDLFSLAAADEQDSVTAAEGDDDVAPLRDRATAAAAAASGVAAGAAAASAATAGTGGGGGNDAALARGAAGPAGKDGRPTRYIPLKAVGDNWLWVRVALSSAI